MSLTLQNSGSNTLLAMVAVQLSTADKMANSQLHQCMHALKEAPPNAKMEVETRLQHTHNYISLVEINLKKPKQLPTECYLLPQQVPVA